MYQNPIKIFVMYIPELNDYHFQILKNIKKYQTTVRSTYELLITMSMHRNIGSVIGNIQVKNRMADAQKNDYHY